MWKRNLAREWLWWVGCFILVVVLAFTNAINPPGGRDLLLAALWFYAVIGAVRLTVWAVWSVIRKSN